MALLDCPRLASGPQLQELEGDVDGVVVALHHQVAAPGARPDHRHVLPRPQHSLAQTLLCTAQSQYNTLQ